MVRSMGVTVGFPPDTVSVHLGQPLALLIGTAWSQSLGAGDATVFAWINSNLHCAAVDAVMLFVSNKWNFIPPFVALFIYRIATGPHRKQACLQAGILVLVIGLVDGSAAALKELVSRLRPCHTLPGVQLLLPCSASFSFPSNHAANSFALAALLARYDRKRAWLWFGVAALVAYSRVYTGVHYPSDVVAGAVLGTILALLATQAVAGLGRLRQRRLVPSD